ncbi:MAG: hypothetical protein EON56_03655 [Alphaproteobacteria bacterium]|nr:MAG: hypothetical protein EON56_03655 [Alphaproteobacteria bacterium]
MSVPPVLGVVGAVICPKCSNDCNDAACQCDPPSFFGDWNTDSEHQALAEPCPVLGADPVATLLRSAALAIGIDVAGNTDPNGVIWVKWPREAFNPLRDDAQAFRLAVKLGLTVRVDNRAGFSWVKGFEGSQPHGDDPCAATRRAIVRAAAVSAPQSKEK